MTTRNQGTCLRFYVHENRRHRGILLYEWLLEQARKSGIHGGTAYRAIAGFGSHGTMHEQHFFELAGDLTVRVDFVVADNDAERLIALAETEKLTVFYVLFPVEFGTTGTGG
ncbi:MAG: DUF190 domain-containing protein [Rhodanobacteraceae bacterium]